MISSHWRARRASKAVIEQILGEIVAASRRPALYESLGAPDRIDEASSLVVAKCVDAQSGPLSCLPDRDTAHG